MLTLTPADPSFPRQLRRLRIGFLQCTRALDFTTPRIGIVGARECDPLLEKYARQLAAECVNRGAIVLSGGACGIDRAAHEGALKAGGRTWLIAPCGSLHVAPPENGDLYRDVGASKGAIIFPFLENTKAMRGGPTYKKRNGVLVAFVDAVIAIQAALKSGTSNTCEQALRARKPVYLVAPAPWASKAAGCVLKTQTLIKQGARHFLTTEEVFKDLAMHLAAARSDPIERAIMETLRKETYPLHRDRLAERAKVSASALSVALFTLVLEGLVREEDGLISYG